MEEKRKRILQMLESGTISMDEALTLLENLKADDDFSSDDRQETNNSAQAETKNTEEKTKKKEKTSTKVEDETSMDDFLDSVRRDFTMVGDRFMQFMQTAVQKVKEIDIEAPFGKSINFNHSKTVDADDVDAIFITIPSGKVTMHVNEDDVIRAELSVKGHSSESDEAEAKEYLLDKITMKVDDNKYQMVSELKMGQVDVDLYLPKKQFKNVTVRVTNGRFKAEGVQADLFQARTTNGSLRLRGLRSEYVEAETMNGLIYIDGDIEEIEAKSLNGSVTVTTTSEKASKIQAKAMTGLVELYVPKNVSLTGKVSTSMGKLELGLEDVEKSEDQEQMFQKSIHFYKDLADEKGRLRVQAETKTGNVLVHYNLSDK